MAPHSTVALRVLSGPRHRTGRLSVRAEVVSRQVPVLVIGYLVLLVGCHHPHCVGYWQTWTGRVILSTIASVIVAVAVLGGGPRLMAAVRRRSVERGERGDGRGPVR